MDSHHLSIRLQEKFHTELSNKLYGSDFNSLVNKITTLLNFSNLGFYHEDYKERLRHAKAISLKTITNLLSDDKVFKEVNITTNFLSKFRMQRVLKTPDENTIVIDARTNNMSFALEFDFSSQYRAITEKELLQRKSRLSKVTTPYRLPRNRLRIHIARKFTDPVKKKYMGRRLIGFEGSKKVYEMTWLYELKCYSTKELVKAITLAFLEAIHYFLTRIKRYIKKLKEITEKTKRIDGRKAYETLMELIIMYSLFLINYDEVKWRTKLREAKILLDKSNFDKLIMCLEGKEFVL